MKNNTDTNTAPASITYTLNGESVELLRVEQYPSGLLAQIAFEDGREDEVPYRALIAR